MKIEVKNWLGVLVLLCLGFVLGRVTMPSNMSATTTLSEVGKYELVCASNIAMFRINTVTGNVEMFETSGMEGKIIKGVWKNMTESNLETEEGE